MKYDSVKSNGITRRTRLSIIFLIILSIVIIPAGCSSDADGIEEDFLEKYETPEENTERVPIMFYFPGQQPVAWDEVRTEIEKELADTVNVSLDFKWIEHQSYVQKMNTLSASSDSFDAFCVGKPQQYYPDFTKMAREGELKDITQLLPDNAPILMQKYTDEELDYAKVDGKLYAVPTLYQHAYGTYILADDALLRKYNISDLSNLDQYDTFLRTVKENEPDSVPGIIGGIADTLQLFAGVSGYVIVDESQRLVYKLEDPDMKVIAWENTSEFREAANYVLNWFHKGYIVKNSKKMTSILLKDDLFPPDQKMTTRYFDPSIDFRVCQLCPDNPLQRENPMGSFYYNGSFVFPATSLNTDRTLQFLDWVQRSRSNYYLFMYGREGTDYVLEKNYPIYPEGMDYTNSTYMNWNGNWAFRNAEFLPVVRDEQGNEVESYSEFLNKSTKYPPHGSFYPDFKAIEIASTKRFKAFLDFEYKLSDGEIVDSSQIDSLIKNLEGMGSANLVELVQKQLDEAVEKRK